MCDAPKLETRRLWLRAVQLEDACDIFSYVKNPNVLQYTSRSPPVELRQTEEFVYGLVNSPEGDFAWSILLKGEPEVIGLIEFNCRHGESGSIDYALSEVHWNKGIMTEAVNAVIDWAFHGNESLLKITSAAMTANPASSTRADKMWDAISLKRASILVKI